MKLKLPSFLGKISPPKEKKEYFLGLEIRSGEIKAAVWQKEKERVALLNLGQASYSSGDWEEALSAADEAIIEASGSLPQEEVEKVIFGLPPPWVAQNKILGPKLEDLKKLCQQLALKPLGFVVISEAVVKYLKQLEGVPPTALIIDVDKGTFTITLVKAGRVEGVKIISDQTPNPTPLKIEEALGELEGEILPSRVLLYGDGENLEKIRGELLSHRWAEKLPFLHLPKIEILESDFDIKALVLTSGAQMGEVILSEEALPPKEEEAERVKVKEEKTSQGREEETVLGFIKGKDILEEEKITPYLTEEEPALELEEKEEEEGGKEERKEVKKMSLPTLKLPQLSLPRFNFALPGQVKWFFLIFILIFLILAGAALAAYWYLLKAEVKVWVQAKSLEKEVEILISPAEKVEEGEVEQLAGKVIEGEEKVSKTVAASGKKTVGEPAKGKIVIYNKTENEKKFPAGTILTGPGDLKFTLDEEAKVASTAPFSLNFSSTPAKVTAAKIGPEGNLPSGENVSFKDYPTSSYFAKSEENFSGGSSREISVATKSDQEKLASDLSAELAAKAKENFRGKLSPEEKLIEETLTSSLKEKKFSKEIDEEATEITLNLTMTFRATAYNESDLKGKFLKSLEESVSSGYELNENATEMIILEAQTKGEETLLKLAVKAHLLPKLNLDQIKKEISGKKEVIGKDYLKGLGSVTQSEVKIYFPLPLPFPVSFSTLPRLPQNIKIEIIST